MHLIAQALAHLEKTETPAERQVILHARAKLREARELFHVTDDDEGDFFELERAYNALFVEVDSLLEQIPEGASASPTGGK